MQVHLISTQQPDASAVCVARRQPGVQYFVEHHGSHLFIMTNASVDEFVRSTQTAAGTPDARAGIAAGGTSAAAYEAAPGDRAEDISFSRWSSADWESAGASPHTDGSPPIGQQPVPYQMSAADGAEDISFSRWSPANWEVKASSATGSNSSDREQSQTPAIAYQAGPGDRAEDISFSRWSPVNWEAKASSSIGSDSGDGKQHQSPVTAYQAGPADRADDISFSRWSPASWETDGLSTDGGGLSGADAAEYRLLRMPIVDDGWPSS